MKFDFSGYATKNGLRCSDGRTIMHDAFKEMDGKQVPLVWQHQHNDPDNVLGHAVLENRNDGVYCYCTLNDSASGEQTKQLIKHGDVNALSIYANQLVQKDSNVLHGTIREVSVVLAGANPGALIDNVAIQHSDGSMDELDDEAVIFSDNFISHASGELVDEEPDGNEDDEDGPTVQDVFDDMTEEQKNVVYFLVGQALDGKNASGSSEVSHAADEDDEDGPTVQDVFDDMTEEQKNVVYFLVGQALDGKKTYASDKPSINKLAKKSAASAAEDNTSNEGDNSMKHNAFDRQSESNSMAGIDQEQAMTILHDALNDKNQASSLRQSLLMHAGDYGIDNIEVLFPDAKAVTNAPEFVKRNNDWVDKFVNGVHHSPFSRIKSLSADITEDEARAKGYIKGKQKLEEIFGVSKRVTTPQTIYKKQKLDRDDIIDITDFEPIAWLKGEMVMMMLEEIGRAILVGDGRTIGAEDKINAANIRPIWTDDELFTIHKSISAFTPDNISDDQGREMVRQIISSMDDYEGTGTPTFYAAPATITALLLLEDKMGRRLYNNLTDLAAALGVASVVKVPIFKGQENDTKILVGIIVNPADYTLGADKGGELNFFEDFDIDFNQQKYLYETRLSGALTKPKTAIALEAPKAQKAPKA